jgi:hypothetical protein
VDMTGVKTILSSMPATKPASKKRYINI